MKILILSVILAATCANLSQAKITLELDAGVLRNATGTATVPSGGLLQLIGTRAGANGTFAAPTANSFVGGDNIIVASFGFNQGGAGFVAGETDNTIIFNLESTVTPSSISFFDVGDALLLRWWPTLTTASTVPGFGTTFGQYRSATGVDGGLAWIAPADGTTLSIPAGLNFLTAAAGGPNLDTAGFATNIVAAIPEPSSLMMLGSAVVGLIGVAKLRRQA